MLNVSGFYDSLNQLTQTMVASGFLKSLNRDMLLTDDKIDALLDKMENYQPPEVVKWLAPTIV
ncbi:MAG: hypothetical protein WKI04_02315 [Ferruginibacter sp.]